MKTNPLFAILLLLSLNGNSQTILSSYTLNSGGVFFESEEYKISSNIGEMLLVNTFFITDYIVSNGVLQPLILKNPASDIETDFKIRLYPTIINNNSTFLETVTDRTLVIKSKLQTVLGQIISQENFVLEPGAKLSKIDISVATKGVYLLDVQAYETSGTLIFKKSFRIQKL